MPESVTEKTTDVGVSGLTAAGSTASGESSGMPASGRTATGSETDAGSPSEGCTDVSSEKAPGVAPLTSMLKTKTPSESAMKPPSGTSFTIESPDGNESCETSSTTAASPIPLTWIV